MQFVCWMCSWSDEWCAGEFLENNKVKRRTEHLTKLSTLHHTPSQAQHEACMGQLHICAYVHVYFSKVFLKPVHVDVKAKTPCLDVYRLTWALAHDTQCPVDIVHIIHVKTKTECLNPIRCGGYRWSCFGAGGGVKNPPPQNLKISGSEAQHV